jgi:hypothetical protein|tara:strand:- start:686 stop:2023 length:1338 start_codon:yes stop_codon:yes gene_type:complete
LASCWFFILFLTSIIFINPIFGEPTDIEIDWIIEGQSIKSQITSETIVETSPIFEEQINNFLSSENKIFYDVAEDYITGSQYMIGDHEITIDSKEGQLLNQLLIEQKQINKDNFHHMIQYLDRYSDGYVELAEALIDPVRQQNYKQNGVTRDFNLNSNLEYFLFERGYDLTNLESIPNNAFSPTKYDDVRAAAAKAANSGATSTDLRELLPNYVKPNSKVTNEEMVRQLTEQTTNVYDSILSNELKISVIQSSDLSNSIPDILFDDFQFVNTNFDSGKFENTQHVIDTLDKPQNLLGINPSSEYPLLILIAIAIVLGLIIFGYLLYRKSIVKETVNLVTVPTSINYVENTNNMIQSSRDLFANNSPKYAFEKFSQAIRYYYSHKLQINLDLTTTKIIIELKKSNVDNFNDIEKWLLLCSQVEFIRHKSTQKEFLSALNSFSKSIS